MSNLRGGVTFRRTELPEDVARGLTFAVACARKTGDVLKAATGSMPVPLDREQDDLAAAERWLASQIRPLRQTRRARSK